MWCCLTTNASTYVSVNMFVNFETTTPLTRTRVWSNCFKWERFKLCFTESQPNRHHLHHHRQQQLFQGCPCPQTAPCYIHVRRTCEALPWLACACHDNVAEESICMYPSRLEGQPQVMQKTWRRLLSFAASVKKKRPMAMKNVYLCMLFRTSASTCTHPWTE